MTDELILPRSTWNPQYADGEPVIVPKAFGVYTHHTVGAQLPANSTVAQECAEMRNLERTGHNRFGYGISYNVIIFPSGRAYQGVSFSRRGQHTDGMNSSVRSICFAGNYEKHEPTQAQLDKARAIVAHGKGLWWEKSAFVKGHRDLKATACPGKNVYKHIPYIASGKVSVTPTTPKPAPKPNPERVTVNVNVPILDLTNAAAKPLRGRSALLLQTLLVFNGYRVGRAGIDGIAGKDTRAALAKFQVATKTGDSKGRADYIVGAGSWRELIGGWNG